LAFWLADEIVYTRDDARDIHTNPALCTFAAIVAQLFALVALSAYLC
jgi:hypothetical protein